MCGIKKYLEDPSKKEGGTCKRFFMIFFIILVLISHSNDPYEEKTLYLEELLPIKTGVSKGCIELVSVGNVCTSWINALPCSKKIYSVNRAIQSPVLLLSVAAFHCV